MEARIDQVVSAVNTWIVGDDEEVIVVDPGTDADAVLARVGDREVIAVICTHGHGGHVSEPGGGALEDGVSAVYRRDSGLCLSYLAGGVPPVWPPDS